MKVRLIAESTIEEYMEGNAQSRVSFKEWLDQIKTADWVQPIDVKSNFSRADLLGNGSNRVIFNISGNSYRMICRYYFGKSKVHLYVCWIGTHAEYDKLCANNNQYTVNNY